MATASLARCPSCDFDLSRSRSAYCQLCDNTFAVDYTDDEAPNLVCPCGSRSLEIIDDAMMPICKFCLAAALDDSPNEAATHPTDWRSTSKKDDPRSEPDTSSEAAAAAAAAASGTMEQSEGEMGARWMPKHAAELWQFVGCVCGNNEPDCFELQSCNRPVKSFYCRDCKQPYGAFLWKEEQGDGQCPKCHGSHVETDAIANGEAVVKCLNCDGTVSKRRLDEHCEAMRQEVLADLATESPRAEGVANCVCHRCGTDGAEWAVGWHNGDARLMQICDACGSADFVVDLDLKRQLSDSPEASPEASPQAQREMPTPDGFEELAQCCGSLATLHPVDSDPEDNLLVCARCSSLVSLAECTNPMVPKTVSDLRRCLEGSFSSGEMGRPYQTVKVRRLDELKPGDQLDFKRALYSHHAILVEPLPKENKLAVIEYTGEINLPTVMACLVSAPSKAQVTKTLLSFSEVEKSLHRVDYHSLDCYLPKVVIQRAGSRVGESQYRVGSSNCEHFSNWAKANVDLSRQADKFKERGRQVLEHPAWDLVGKAAKQGLGVGFKRQTALDFVQDVREELRHLFAMEKGASSQALRTILRLGLKFGIRLMPQLISVVFGKTSLNPRLALELDSLKMKPFADKLADTLLPVKNVEEGEEKRQQAQYM